MDYEERRKQDGRHKRADSPGTGCALAEAPGTAQGNKKERLSAAEVADHEPGPDRNHLHHGGGNLHSAGGTGVKGGDDNEKDAFDLPANKTGDGIPADEAEKGRCAALQELVLQGLRKVVHEELYEAET